MLAISVWLTYAGTTQAETGALVRKLPVADDCVPISLTGAFASRSAADALSPVPEHLVAFRRQAMNAMAAEKRPKADRLSEITVNAVAGSSLTVPGSLMRDILLGLGASEEAAGGLLNRDYTADYLEPGVYLFEISEDGPSEYRVLTAQPFLAFVLPDKPLGLRLDVMLYAVDARQSVGTGQIIYPYPVCLTAEITTGNLTINLGEVGEFKNGGIKVTPDAIHALPGTDYKPYRPPETSVADPEGAELAAVEAAEDPATLVKLALGTKSTKVILAVIEKLDDQEAFKRLALELEWPRGREHAMLQVTDQAFLTSAAFGSDMPMVRRAAVYKLEDQKTLLEIALSDSDYAIRRDAAEHINDPELLEKLAASSDYQWVTDIANKSMGRAKGTLNLNGQLIKAAEEGNADSVSKLIDNGAAVTSVDAKLNTALIQAALSGNAEIVSLLLAKGADIRRTNSSRTSALKSAAALGHDDVVDILLHSGAIVDSRSFDGSTPLMLAAYYGHQTTVASLINADAEVDLQSRDGRTALMIAASQGHPTIVAMLLKAGADVSLKDSNGNTAAAVAKSASIREMISPADDDQQVASVTETRSRITDGSYSWNNGKLQIETSFEGETIVLDQKHGGVAKLTSGMTRAQVVEALVAGNVHFEKVTDNEWKAGDTALIFVSDRLTKLRSF